MKNKIIMNIILIICICLFLYSGYYVFLWLKFDKETKKLENELFSEVISTKMNEEGNEEDEIEVDFKKLKEINSDVIGWIKIDNTYINYPIMQGETDEYYLRKDINKNYNFSGSIFVFTNVNSEFLDENTIIYGHNMKNERMFANLNEIYSGNLGTDININIYTEKSFKKYKVFSCYIEKPNLEVTKTKFADMEDKKNYINNAINKSKINFDETLNYDNKLITLITCGKTSEERIIVHAIEI